MREKKKKIKRRKIEENSWVICMIFHGFHELMMGYYVCFCFAADVCVFFPFAISCIVNVESLKLCHACD